MDKNQVGKLKNKTKKVAFIKINLMIKKSRYLIFLQVTCTDPYILSTYQIVQNGPKQFILVHISYINSTKNIKICLKTSRSIQSLLAKTENPPLRKILHTQQQIVQSPKQFTYSTQQSVLGKKNRIFIFQCYYHTVI